uniref:Chromatin target of PRMT1 protein C-terminal domain-containing protein n=1 Tax=Romanomermis culicivorax TaxID=13658 RepID=A0A915KTH5_ROMCU
MPPVSASNGLPVPSKIVMKGNSTMTLHERFSDITPPKIEQQPKIVEPIVTARLDIGRGDFKLERTPHRDDDFFDRGDYDLSPPRFDRRNGAGYSVYSMKNRREMTSQMSRNRSLSRRLGSKNSIYEALRDQRTSLKSRLGAKGRLGSGFRVDDDGWRERRTPTKVSPFDDLDTIFRYQRLNGVFRNTRTRSRFTNRGFQKRRFGYRRNGFSRFGTQRYRNRRFGNNSTFRFGGSKYQPQTRSEQNNKQLFVSKEVLDDEIDAYMAKTKLNLDNDLDAYMADV